MDFAKQVYVKTAAGEEAMRQTTRVVQRNLRMVLVQVDGKLSAEQLSEKIGNPKLVEKALRELEAGGFISPFVGQQPSLTAPTPALAEKQSGAGRVEPHLGDRPLASVAVQSPSSASVQLSAAPNFGRLSLPQRQKMTPAGESTLRKKHPLRWLRSLMVGGLLLLLLSLIVLLLYPYDNFRSAFEERASQYVQQSVRIGRIEFDLTPRPALVLRDVSLGAGNYPEIAEIRIPRPWELWGQKNGVHFSRLELLRVRLRVDQVLSLAFLNAPETGSPVRIDQLRVGALEVEAGGLIIGGLNGDFYLGSDGMERAVLSTADRNLNVELRPIQGGMRVLADAYGWQSGEGGLRFDTLQVDGLLQPGFLRLERVDARLLGGGLQGSGLLEWGDGLRLLGDAKLNYLAPRQVTAHFAPNLKLDGEMTGSLHLAAESRTPDTLLDNMTATLDFDLLRGVLFGVDLGEAARRDGLDVRGGATKFDRLHGKLSVQGEQIRLRDMQINAGIFSAQGQANADRKGNIDGFAVVAINSSSAPIRTNVLVRGRLPDLLSSSRK